MITEVRDLGDGRKGLFQRVEFATEINPIAKVAYGLYRHGFLNAVSVGFVPIRWEEGTEKSGFRRRYLEQELLEVSAVAVPANREALLVTGIRGQESGVRGEGAGVRGQEIANLARELRDAMRLGKLEDMGRMPMPRREQ